MKKLVLTLLAVFAAFVTYAQSEIKVEVHRVVSEGEQFNLTFIIEGENSPSDFTWHPTDDFQVLWGPQTGKSSSLSIVNGKKTKSEQSTYTYVLRAVSAGKFTVPSASARVKGKTITSSPVTVEVVNGSSQASASQSSHSTSRSSQSSASDIFLVMSVSQKNAVVGEPLIATLKLYQRVNIAGFETVNFPSFNGFWSQELEAPGNIEFVREAYDGKIYNVALLRKFVLIPQHEGTITIDPAELVCLVQIRVSSGGSSIFDGFFDDYKTIRQKAVSKPLEINVKALPAGAPASFAGGVGTFSISAELSKDVIKTHEAASLIVTVTGEGNVSLLGAPKVNFPPDMEVYDTKVSDKIAKGGLRGSKVYEFPFIPRSYGDFEIEPVKYSYYDVSQRKYVTLQTEPFTLKVEKGNEQDAGGQIVMPVGKKGVKNIGTDIRFINVKDPALVAKGAFFVGSVLFWIIVTVLVIAAFVLWATLRKIARRRADVVGTKHRKATKMALKRLHLANTFLKQDLKTAFYEELHKALLGFISDKLNMPATELSRDKIADNLLSAGVAREWVDSYMGLLDTCEFARYAPESGSGAMEGYYNSALEVISAIDSDMKTNRSSVKTGVLVALLLMAVPGAASARQVYVDSLWNAASQAYTDGLWQEAAASYEQISSIGLESAALYCNMGNAYYKDGNIARAILNYERALKVDPSYADARFNLEFMNEQIRDQIDPVPDFILAVWMEKICRVMDSDAWAVVFLVLLALTLAMILLFLLSPSVAGRKTGFSLGLVCLFFAVASITFSIWQKTGYEKADGAVVMSSVVSVKSSPSSEGSPNLFVLHEGTKVNVLEEVGTWYKIELADGRQGWLPAKDIEII